MYRSFHIIIDDLLYSEQFMNLSLKLNTYMDTKRFSTDARKLKEDLANYLTAMDYLKINTTT